MMSFGELVRLHRIGKGCVMFRVIIGQAQGIETECTAADVIRQCRDGLAGDVAKAGLLFAASEFDLELLTQMVGDAFPGLPVVGCTTAGIFSTAMGVSRDSISLMLFVSDAVEFAVGLGENTRQNASQTARDAAAMALSTHPGERPAMAFMFPDVRLAPGEVVTTLSESLGCPVFGGFAGGEGEERGDARQFFGNAVCQGAVVVLALFGPAKAVFRISNSWHPVGNRVRVDAVSGRKVLRIDGKTALDFYRETLGPHVAPATEMPLAVFEGGDNFTIRGPLYYDEADGSIVVSDSVQEGAQVRITEATRENILEDVESSLHDLVATLPPDFVPDAALVFSCYARSNILGLRAREEFELLRRILPSGLPILGFHAYGEIGPVTLGESAKYHNCTLITVLFGDGKGEGAAIAPEPVPSPQPQCFSDTMAARDREIRFLKKQLARAGALVARLEHLRDTASGLQRRMNTELLEANLTIQEKNRLLREALALAEEVQLRLLPRDNPTVPGFDIVGRSIYCDETGGDYYDYLAVPGTDPGSLAVVVGDVTGHGIASALLMTTARALLRMRVSMGGDPAGQVADLNHLLTQDTAETGRFVTLFYLFLEPSPEGMGAGRMRWVRAGHDPALLYDPACGTFLELSEGGGVPLGIIGDVVYKEFVFEGMAGGQVVALGTDGIWEARNREGLMFGKRRLRRIIKENCDLPAKEIVDLVLEELEAFRRGGPAEDDVTLVVVKVL